MILFYLVNSLYYCERFFRMLCALLPFCDYPFGNVVLGSGGASLLLVLLIEHFFLVENFSRVNVLCRQLSLFFFRRCYFLRSL